MKALLIGCGSNLTRKVSLDGVMTFDRAELVTLDYNADHKPDVVFDLKYVIPEGEPTPFADNAFDEIHAYEVLEHVGHQGDYEAFFAQFSEFYRILKPGGLFCATVPKPTSVWAWGDPSHTRVIPLESLQFLSQAEYARQVGITAMSDFRSIYRADFETIMTADYGEHSNAFILRAIKDA